MSPQNPPWLTASEALTRLRSGMRVFVGSGCAAPQLLVEALAARAPEVFDVEVLHILTHGDAPYARRELQDHFRQNSFFIGGNVRGAVHDGAADYSPVFLSEIPRLFRERRIHLDVALVQVTPPDPHGFCSFGVSVDVVKAAVESADWVIAEVNPNLPRTLGDSFVHVSALDALVRSERPLLELPAEPSSPEALKIAEFIESLVPDGATLQTGIGAIPSAVLGALSGKRDLGMHTEMLTEAVVPLIESGVLNGSRKTLLAGKIVTSFCFGNRAFYDYLADNPAFEFRPTEFTNDPFQIARNDRMIAISSAIEVDLTGQVCADSIGGRFYSGFGGQTDFMRGAARSREGKPIIALPSVTRDGRVSRITAWLKTGAGVVTTRADVHYVVTEYGVAQLHGKTVRERALALIHVAHPKFREELLREARDHRLVPSHQIALPAGLQPYPRKYELECLLEPDLRVRVRPIQPADERRLKELFYSHEPATIYQRYFSEMRRLPTELAQRLVTLDYRDDMALVALVPDGGAERFIAVARYHRDPATQQAEIAVVVHEAFRRRGLAALLLRQLARVAAEQGIVGFEATVLPDNRAVLSLIQKLAEPVESRTADGTTHVRFALTAVRPTPLAAG
ncbi:MAG: acetyl-CoA hydrolase/transferase family protein [Verrucomicrobia bacterium]|nr:acetyl-CoA hydrolase/transferase family protein [Verrucomicrobiota bacterium]